MCVAPHIDSRLSNEEKLFPLMGKAFTLETGEMKKKLFNSYPVKSAQKN